MPPPAFTMAQKSMNVQAQIRRNAEETTSYLTEVGKWEKEIKKKDAELRAKKKAQGKKKKMPVRSSPSSSSSSSNSTSLSTYDPTSIRESGGLISAGFTSAVPSDYEVPAAALESMKKRTHDEDSDKQHHRGVMLGGGTENKLTPANAVKVASAYDGKTPVPKPKGE